MVMVAQGQSQTGTDLISGSALYDRMTVGTTTVRLGLDLGPCNGDEAGPFLDTLSALCEGTYSAPRKALGAIRNDDWRVLVYFMYDLLHVSGLGIVLVQHSHNSIEFTVQNACALRLRSQISHLMGGRPRLTHLITLERD